MDTPELGDRVKDKITGLTGIMVGIAYWVSNCVRAAVQPETAKDGKAPDSVWIDMPLLEVVKKGVIPRPVMAPNYLAAPAEAAAPRRRTGGPRPDPARRVDPKR